MLQEMLITLDLFSTKMTQKNQMYEWKENFGHPWSLKFWIKIKHFLEFQNQSYPLLFTGLKWKFLLSQKQFTVYRIVWVGRDPQGSSSDQSQHESLCPIQLPRSPWGPDSPCLCVPQMGTLPHQNVFSMASPHSRGLGQSCEVSHRLSHKEKQPLFLIFTGTVSSKSFFLWQLSILMKHTVSHGKICDVFYRLLNAPQKTDLKNEWRPIPLKADFPCQENKKIFELIW